MPDKHLVSKEDMTLIQGGLSFSIDGWSAWAPGIQTLEEWQAWAASGEGFEDSPDNPKVDDLPSNLRRRLSRLGKMVHRVALDVEQAESAQIVFSSRNGNVAQMLKLLQSVAVAEPVSPTRFGLSVHNSLIGILSIVTRNTKAQTAVGAGSESFCMGLLEALAMVSEQPKEPVLFIHCDEVLPQFYAPFQDPAVAACAVALLIKAAEAEKMTFGFSGHGLRLLPGDPLKSFLRFMISDDHTWLWGGAQGEWFCQKHA